MLYDDIQRYIRLNVSKETGFTRNEILELTLPGVHKLVNMMFDFLSVYDAKLVKVYVMRGLLKFVLRDTKFPKENFAQRVAYSFTGQSARMCVITGQRTFRRKHIWGWPCLITPLYVQYLNEADERETQNASI